MATPSVAERVRHGLGVLLHRQRDPEREREWAIREAEVELERRESADGPVGGMRGSAPYSLGHAKRH